MNILTVDDNATNRKLLRAQLEAEGHAVLEAADGVEALAVLERAPVDAVTSDILMPNLDGFGLCHAVRKHARFSALPFIVYTSTYTSASDRHLAETIGADRYLTMPVPVSAMLEALAAAKQTAAARKTAPTAPPADAVVFKEYNAVLVNKLEKKNTELEETLEKLQRAHERIREQNRDLERRVEKRTAKLEKTNAELHAALAHVKELSGLLPICSYCKKIRADKSYWQSVEGYISKHSEAKFSHCTCPECYEKIVRPELLQAGISPDKLDALNRPNPENP